MASLPEDAGARKEISAENNWFRALLGGRTAWPVIEILVELFDLSWSFFGSVLAFLTVLAVATKILGFPLSIWANRGLSENHTTLLAIGPELQSLRSQHRGEEQAEKILELYRRANYRPFLALKSSAVLLVQIPVFIWVFVGVSSSEKARGQQFLMVNDLTQPDGLLVLGSLNLNVLPVLMAAVSVGNLLHIARLKNMMAAQLVSGWAITLGFFIVLYSSPSALVLYWMLNIMLQWSSDVVVHHREVKSGNI